MKSAQLKMERLRAAIASECARAFPGMRPVFGEGPVPCPVMVVGEAPGRDETRLERPFVGKAGSFFIGIFERSTGLKRGEAYITNVLKVWPTVQTKRLRTRKPSMDEEALFRPLLAEEVRLVDPRVILAVGKTAFGALVPGGEFAPGKWQAVDGRSVMPVYHPSYLLRRQRSLTEGVRALEQALRAVKGRLAGQ